MPPQHHSCRSTNPIYAPKDATSRYTSPSHVVELVVLDKDMLTKEYLGEVALLLDDWFWTRHLGSMFLVIG